MWDQLEPTAPHIVYVVLPIFLSVYSLFSHFIRNHLHLSEPPLAVLFGIILGPHAWHLLRPRHWGLNDEILQETTGLIVGIQCFGVGLELSKLYFNRHWKSVAYFLGPVMIISCGITAFFAYLIFKTSIPTALVIGACLSPTDPLLVASVLSQGPGSARESQEA
jgi:NhaP-type Na+/H+ or K+/H+ antiporter